MTSQAAPAAAARYTHPREPYRTWNSKAEADAHYAKIDAVKAEQDALNEKNLRIFDFDLSDGSDSLWETDRGFWNNLGNLATNTAGGALGGVGGFLVGGTAGAGAGAGLGWSGANQGYDFIEDKVTGDYERNALIDYGTALATGAGLVGGAAYNNYLGSGVSGGASGGSSRGGYNPVSGNTGGGSSGGGGGGLPGGGLPGGGQGGSGDSGGGNNFLGDMYDFFTKNPIGQGIATTGVGYVGDQIFNDGQGTNAVMDFLTGGGSSSSGGNEIAYGTDLTPQYIVDAQKEALDRARTLTNSYADYEGPLSASAAQNELLAANVASDAVGGTADALNDARDMTTGADARYERREGPSSYGSGDDFFDQASLSGYMNPYLDFVQQDTLDNISRENEAIQAALGDQMIQVGAFGGSRTGVAEAENNRNMRQQMLQYINQSNAEAFENARDQFNRDEDRRFAYSEADRNQFNTDLARRLNVGQALGSLASMDSALTQQEINNLMSTGGVLRGIEQAGYTNDFNAYQDFWNRMLGLNAAENAVALGLQSNVLEPPAPEEDPDRLGQILGVLAAGAGLYNTLAGKPNDG
jgi:hypothetical protein